MQPLTILLVLISAVMHALRNFYNKRALDKQAFVWWYEIFGLVFFTPIFLFVLFQEDTSGSVPVILIILSGFAHFIYWYFLCKALEKGDLSLVYPIMRSSPALVLVFSIFLLKEDITAQGIIGILLVAVGVYTISLDKFDIQSLYSPIRAVFRDRAILFAFLTLLSVAFYSLVDKIAVGRMNPVIFAYLYPWISLSLFTGYIFRTKNEGVLIKEIALHKKSILLCGALSIFGYFLILWAFTMGPMSYIVGLRQLSIVFAVMLGGQILGEKNKLHRLFSSVIIFAGAYMIAIAG